MEAADAARRSACLTTMMGFGKFRVLRQSCIIVAFLMFPRNSYSLALPISSSVRPGRNGPIGSYGSRRSALASVKDPPTAERSESNKSTGISSGNVPDGEQMMEPICRIVTRADAKLPTSCSMLPPSLCQSPFLLDKLDAFYHAQAHKRTQTLRYLEGTAKRGCGELQANDKAEEKKLVSVVRNSLEDAGFELLSRRDIDLCESLNAGYLLRLSILPDVSELDPKIAQEFYPEHFYANGTVIDKEELLFEGGVLVYWRGYSEEVNKGRLLLPKIDYLQASLVQRSAAWLKKRLDKVESELVKNVLTQTQKLKRKAQESVVSIAESVPVKNLAKLARDVIADESNMEGVMLANGDNKLASEGSLKLGRYGGSKIRFVGSPDPSDALVPFTICEINYDESAPCPNAHENYLHKLDGENLNATVAAVEHNMNEGVNHQGYTCEYDDKMSKNNAGQALPRMQLLERVSISNLVDFFTQHGRRKLVQALFEQSELVEPTYEEVVVVWRPLVKQNQKLYPPKFVSEFADMLDIEGFDQPPKQPKEPPKGKLEIRNFERVPMSNLPAVLPKTKLIFRPADAFLFDSISFVTLIVVLGSIRLDSPRLDLIALVSVALWSFRTVIRYSNKLARYDLLVKKFLTSKISHRNAGALKYLTSEAGSQRAVRASLVHSWISHLFKLVKSPFQREGESEKPITRSFLKKSCVDDVNKLLKIDKEVQIDVDRAMKDLEALRLLRFSSDGEELLDAKDSIASAQIIRETWADLLENDCNDDSFDGRNPTDSFDPSEENQLDSDTGSKVNAAKQLISLKDLEERRKWCMATPETTGKKSYAKVMQDKKGASSLKATLGGQQDTGFSSIGRRRSNRGDMQYYF